MWRAGREAALTDRFVSNFTNRLDAKGRVSIPSSFRAVLAKDGYEGLYVHPALDLAAFDAGGHALRRTIDDILARFSPFSEEWDSLSAALNGTSEVLKVDPEGRIMLSEALKAHTGIGDAVTFVGHGHKFQIWEPQRFKAHLDAAHARLRDVKRMLGALPPSGAAGT
jgi:MraZ protein